MSTASIFIAGFDIIKYEKKVLILGMLPSLKSKWGAVGNRLFVLYVCVFMLLASWQLLHWSVLEAQDVMRPVHLHRLEQPFSTRLRSSPPNGGHLPSCQHRPEQISFCVCMCVREHTRVYEKMRKDTLITTAWLLPLCIFCSVLLALLFKPLKYLRRETFLYSFPNKIFPSFLLPHALLIGRISTSAKTYHATMLY